jgi:hypothetical protein
VKAFIASGRFIVSFITPSVSVHSSSAMAGLSQNGS